MTRRDRVLLVGATLFLAWLATSVASAALPEGITVLTCEVVAQTAAEERDGEYVCVAGSEAIGANFRLKAGGPFELRMRELVGKVVDVKLQVVAQ